MNSLDPNIFNVKLEDLSSGDKLTVLTGKNIVGLLKNRLVEKKKVLDFGGGGGGVSACLSTLGYDVTYVEIDETAMQYAKYLKNRFNLNFRIISYKRFKREKEDYDVCIMRDVLEHLESMNILKEICEKSQEIFIVTPNKFSLLLLFSDPHAKLPLLSLFSRKQLRIFYKCIGRKIDNYLDVDLFTNYRIIRTLKEYGYKNIENISKEYYSKREYYYHENRKLLSKVILMFSNLFGKYIFNNIISPTLAVYAKRDQ